MTIFQKVIKYLAMALAIFLAVSIIGGILSAVGLIGDFLSGDDVAENMTSHTISSNIRHLDIEISVADLYIKEGEIFSVESNLKHLKVEEEGGLLKIEEDKKPFGRYSGAVLTIYVPSGTVFDKAVLTTGVGRITISGGVFNDLKLEMGVGQLNLTSVLTGECEFDLGIGESNITIIGNRDDYKLDIEKGIGNIILDGKNISNLNGSGNGQEHVEISGGIGAINVKFKEPEKE